MSMKPIKNWTRREDFKIYLRNFIIYPETSVSCLLVSVQKPVYQLLIPLNL